MTVDITPLKLDINIPNLMPVNWLKRSFIGAG
jgi:hypothetical protein